METAWCYVVLSVQKSGEDRVQLQHRVARLVAGRAGILRDCQLRWLCCQLIGEYIVVFAQLFSFDTKALIT